ncbi:similar to Saccharomyces cerevisiae YDR263C DIN7 Mitochondrial nuclease functioning in DNA repair and replication [Maudiozyma saulgeensis]|uniref:Similar to Saccharomyces cerevisiae YDR263C DIN7 Mitochondrial nuclease functioning in DNA repair and replication n=1 Tax=Maudiozyma saulgeensis TaxID=1789683 RepID=A0A1X7QZ63_9SACH|nr:similar to Saccharomyces cerevisiae YDR263C DIN7 Mitochondrial nuclease functioning in DNA repair and replication [Kazachstania saulgeensis]
MGVTGLLTKLKPIQKQITLDQLYSKRLAIDGYSWLHKATIGCSYELMMDLNTNTYLKYFIKRINMLKRYNIKPYFVFDGAKINVKEGIESSRLEKRILNKKRGISLWDTGKHLEAIEYFKKSVDVTPQMAKCIIDYCRSENIDYIVAPFEADSQMVYLEKEGLVDGIISEDSDLLIFGCKNLITKLNDRGEARQIERKDFNMLEEPFSIGKFSPEQLRLMVCLSGCDYTKGLGHIGLTFAYMFTSTGKSIEGILEDFIESGKLTTESAEIFLKEYYFADCSFQFQRVFSPTQQKVVTLNDITSEYLYDFKKSRILYSSIGKVINKRTRIVEYIENDEDIDHEMHRLISIGERDPSNFQTRLVSRENLINESGETQNSIQFYYSNLWNKYASPLPLHPIFNKTPVGSLSLSCN